MLVRLAIFFALLLALAPDSSAAAAKARADGAAATVSHQAERGHPAIEADRGPLDEAVRGADRAELLTTLGQVLATDGALPRASAGIPAPAACDAAGWSDVVQCRRWSGAQLLRWATPPPARVS